MSDMSHTERDLLFQYLALGDTPCPSCGYNLRGLLTTKCPECGLEFKLGIGQAQTGAGYLIAGVIAFSVMLGLHGVVILGSFVEVRFGIWFWFQSVLFLLDAGALVFWVALHSRVAALSLWSRRAAAAACWLWPVIDFVLTYKIAQRIH